MTLPNRVRGCQVYMAHVNDSTDPARTRKTACTIVSPRHLMTYAHTRGEADGSGLLTVRNLPTDEEGNVLVSIPVSSSAGLIPVRWS